MEKWVQSVFKKNRKLFTIWAIWLSISCILLMWKNKELPQIKESKLPIELPSIYINKNAIKKENHLLAIFRNKLWDWKYEITLCFNDEDHPLFDKAYDELRKFIHHRKIDLESFIAYTGSNNKITDFEFIKTYSWNSKYDDTSNLHKSKKIWSTSELYMATRNNMFLEYKPDSNDEYFSIDLDNIPVYSLSRKDLDTYFEE